jgi:hypothetical protein
MNNIPSQITFPSSKTSIGLIKYGQFEQYERNLVKAIVNKSHQLLSM